MLRTLATAALALFAITAAAAAEPSVEVIDGVRHVRNGAEPLNGVRTLQLEEQWRVNVDDEEELIGVITVAAAGPDDTVWLADTQVGQILVYSAAGEYVETLSREGEGPGEVQNPDGLFWLPDGNLGIKDRKMGQFTVIDTEGVPRSSIHLEDEAGESLSASWIHQARCRGGVLVVCGNQFRNEEDGTPTQSRYFGVFDLEGSEIARFMNAPSGFDFGARTYDEKKNWFVDQGQFDVDAEGRVYFAAERDRYRIHVCDASGKLVTVIEREYEPRRRTKEEIDGMADNVSMSINGESIRLDSEFLDTSAAIAGIHILDDGTVWVKNGHSEFVEDGDPADSYDVFDADGRFVEVVHVEVESDRSQDRLYHLDDGRWIMVENLMSAWGSMYGGRGGDDDEAEDDGEDGVLEIVCLKGR